MHILITGANGFLAREIIRRLNVAGHHIIACVHSSLLPNTPHAQVIKTDFTQSIHTQYWIPLLDKVDVVINCVGVFQTIQESTMWKIHYEAPKALFKACEEKGIKKIIHISALGIDKVDVPYATSKLAIEKYLQTLNVDSTIIRPGLVYGQGSYGGTSLFRGLCGLPFVIPLPGKALQLQQPIHIDDLTHIVEISLDNQGKQLLCAVGQEKITVKNTLIKLRNWLGFKKARAISIPQIFINIGAKLGNFIPNSPLSETGVKMMAVDNIATDEEMNNLENNIHFKPRGFSDGLDNMVSNVQDRWHARLYFLRPLLRLSIAFLWIYSGIISIFPSLHSGLNLLSQSDIPTYAQVFVLYTLSIMDILLGLATLFNFRLLTVGTVQSFLIIAYTVAITFMMPEYWLQPFTPIAKNIPLLVATFIMMALESER